MPNRMMREGLIYSGRINQVGLEAEAMFVRLVLAADDFGLLEIDPYFLKHRCVSARDDVTVAKIAGMVSDLIEAKLLRPYTDEGKEYAAIDKWEQRRNAKHPKCPPPPWIERDEHGWLIWQASGSHIIGGYVDRKARLVPPENPRERPLEPEKKSKPSADPVNATHTVSRGTRLTIDTLPEAWAAWTGRECPALVVGNVWASFADYWRAQPGQKGVKADWEATWRNWCRRELESGPRGAPRGFGGQQPNRQLALEARNRAAAGLPPLPETPQ